MNWNMRILMPPGQSFMYMAEVCIPFRQRQNENAILIAQEFQKLLPVEQNPMYTEGYEGFFHLDAISGNVEEVTADYIIRDHNRQLFEQKKSCSCPVRIS